MNKSNRRGGFLSKARIEALTDGIFAIAMTLLVLDMKVPNLPKGVTAAALELRVYDLWPKFLIYVLSFVICAVFWVSHSIQFHYIRRADRPFLWINVVFMMFVAFIPFSTHLLSEHIGQRFAVIFYGFHLTVIWICLYLHWRYATSGLKLVDEEIDPRIVKAVSIRILIAPNIYLLAIAASFLSTGLSIALYAFIIILNILPGRIDRHLALSKNTDSK